MRYRLLLLLAVVVACVSLAMTGSHLKFRIDTGPVHAPLPPSAASYLGVFEPGVPPNYGPVTQFARTVGKSPTLSVITADRHSHSHPHSRTSSTITTAFRMSRLTPSTPRSLVSPRARTMAIFVPMPTACGISAIQLSSDSGTR